MASPSLNYTGDPTLDLAIVLKLNSYSPFCRMLFLVLNQNETRCPSWSEAGLASEVGFTDLSDSDEMTDLPWALRTFCQN